MCNELVLGAAHKEVAACFPGFGLMISQYGLNEFMMGLCLFGIWDRAWEQFPRYRAYTASHLTLSLQVFWEYMMKMSLHWGMACFLRFKFLPVLKNKESAHQWWVLMFAKSWKFPVCVEFVGTYWSMLEYTDIWEQLSQTKSASASAVALVKKRLETQSVLSISNLKGNDPLQFS